MNDPSFCQPPSLTPLFHSSPSPCQFPQHIQSFPSLKLFSNVSISVPPTPITIPSLSPFWIAIVASWLSFCFSFCPNSPTHFLKKKKIIYLVVPNLSCSPWDFFFFLGAACEISFSDQGSNLGPCIGSVES